MAVDKMLMASGTPRRMGAAGFTLASTVEEAFGGFSHRVTSVMGTEPVPVPQTGVMGRYPIPPGPVDPGGSLAGRTFDAGELYPTWSTVAHALPFHTQRPVGGGIDKGAAAPGTAAGSSLPADLVVTPQLLTRTGAKQARVTTAPKSQMRWVRQGG
jgi:hypothetical protein